MCTRVIHEMYKRHACVQEAYIMCAKGIGYAPKKNLPCTVRFTLDRLMKTEVKRLLNGL